MIQACQNSGVGALGSSSADVPAVRTASNSTDDKHVVLVRDHTVLLLASKPGNIFNLSKDFFLPWCLVMNVFF